MPIFEQGDVVRVPFPYTDRSTRQYRPALVISRSPIGLNDTLIWVAMITSEENPHWDGDVNFGNRHLSCGLPAPSKVRPCKLATIESNSAHLLGRAESRLVNLVLTAIQQYLGNSNLH